MRAFVLLACVAAMIFPPWSLAESQDSESASNPIEFTIATIKRGRQLYTVHCVSCHGIDGRGDTEMREFLKTPPADLTDELWFYGGTDAVLFEVTQMGRDERDMPAFGAKLSDERIWQIVSYIRYLGGKRP